MVFFVCWLFGVIRRMVEVLFGGSAPFFLICLQITFTNLYGLSNASLWGLTIYNHIKKVKMEGNRHIPFPAEDAVPNPKNEARPRPEELPGNKLMNEEEVNYDAQNGKLVEIDLSADGDSGLVEVHNETE